MRVAWRLGGGLCLRIRYATALRLELERVGVVRWRISLSTGEIRGKRMPTMRRGAKFAYRVGRRGSHEEAPSTRSLAQS